MGHQHFVCIAGLLVVSHGGLADDSRCYVTKVLSAKWLDESTISVFHETSCIVKGNSASERGATILWDADSNTLVAAIGVVIDVRACTLGPLSATWTDFKLESDVSEKLAGFELTTMAQQDYETYSSSRNQPLCLGMPKIIGDLRGYDIYYPDGSSNRFGLRIPPRDKRITR